MVGPSVAGTAWPRWWSYVATSLGTRNRYRAAKRSTVADVAGCSAPTDSRTTGTDEHRGLEGRAGPGEDVAVDAVENRQPVLPQLGMPPVFPTHEIEVETDLGVDRLLHPGPGEQVQVVFGPSVGPDEGRGLLEAEGQGELQAARRERLPRRTHAGRPAHDADAVGATSTLRR